MHFTTTISGSYSSVCYSYIYDEKTNDQVVKMALNIINESF